MTNPLKKVALRARTTWDLNKGTLAVVATATSALLFAGWLSAAKQWNQFLDENDLHEKFYEIEK